MNIRQSIARAGSFFIVLTLGVFCLVARAENPLHLYIEAEDCEGLLRYPYDNENADGWYAREACARGSLGAPGRTYCAAIHENAPEKNRVMRYKLAKPIPPGKYKAFLRAGGAYYPEDETILRVRFGNMPVDFKWGKEKMRWKWTSGAEVTVDNAVAEIGFEAIKFGGRKKARFYNPWHRSIWIDTLYITSDLSEVSPPDTDQERAIRAGVPVDQMPERAVYRVDQDGPYRGTTPEPVGKVDARPILLQSLDGRKNMLPNSSLELGMNDGWMTQGNHVFTDADLDKKDPFHGLYSLRIPAGLGFSRPYYLEKGAEVTFSAYLRGEGPIELHLMRWEGWGKGKLRNDLVSNPALSVKGTLGKEWQRLTVSGTLKEGWYYVSARGQNDFWIDAMQLENGKEATAYAPRAKLEGAIRTGQLGNILYDDQKNLDVWLHNSGNDTINASLEYKITDIREQVVAEGKTESMKVNAGQTLKQSVAPVPGLRGMFSISYAIDGRAMPEGETICVVMPEPAKKPTRHQLGAHMQPRRVELAVHSRLGFTWVLTCKSRQFASASEGVHPAPDVWNWYDEAAASATDYNMQIMPCFWPSRCAQKFMMTECNIPNRNNQTTMLDPVIWSDYVSKIADHYKKHIQTWCFDDEVEMSDTPNLVAALVNVTSDALRKNVPGIRLGICAYPSFQEEMFEFVSPDKLDDLGGGYFDFDYWEGRKVKRMSERYKKRAVCYGVGGRPPAATMYHTLYTYKPIYWNASRMARRVINLMLIQDVWVSGHYASIIDNYGNHMNRNKPLLDYDGTPLPWGGTFGCLGTLLADAEPLDDIPLGDTGRRVYVFRTGKELGAVTWATCKRDADIRWRPAERELKDLTLACAKGSVDVLDMYWNKKNDAPWTDGKLKLDLNEEPIFIMDRGLGREKFTQMFRAATAAPSKMHTAMRFVGNKNGKIELKIKVINDSGRDQKGMTLDFRLPKTDDCAPLSVAGTWLLPCPWVKVGDLPAGKEKTLTLATSLDGSVPYEDGQLRAYLKSDAGVEGATDEYLWLLPATETKKAPAIDGKLDEWQNRSAAWLYYNLIWNQIERRVIQWDDGGESFSYPPYRVDARAAFWAGWDQENLYLAIKLEDDQPMLSKDNGETVKLVIGDGQVKNTVILKPQTDGSVGVSGTDGKGRCAVTQRDVFTGALAELKPLKSVDMEVAIPWKTLSITPTADSVIGFDLFWTDVDKEEGEVVAGTLRWAGGATDTGYLILKN